MEIVDKIETPEPMPRTYGLGTRNGKGVHIVYPISSFLTAAVQLSPKETLELDISGWQEHRRFLEARTRRRQHTRPDSPIFELSGRASKFIDVDPSEVKEAILEGIVKEEGAMNLWENDLNDEAIKQGHYGRFFLSGQIKSKSNARGRKAHRKVSINNPNLNRDGTLGINQMLCECEDSYYNDMRSKLYGVACHHIAALQIAYHQAATKRESGIIKFDKEIPTNPALPFNINANNSEAISYLNIEFLIARYVRKMSFYKINRRLTRLGSLLFTPAINTMLEQGYMWFEVVRQGLRKTKEDPEYIAATEETIEKMQKHLRTEGYFYRGYSLEYEGTNFEAIGQRWENRDGEKSITIVYKEDIPLHFIIKSYIGHEVDLFGDRKVTVLESRRGSILSQHPYMRIGRKYYEIDDMTRRYCEARVMVPGKKNLQIPKIIHDRQVSVYLEQRKLAKAS